jgi:hypothetical protein
MKNILIQLDTDRKPSSFDQVVAFDAGVDQVLSYGDVTVDDVEPLVHGAMFTRGGNDLRHTAIFIGGSNVAAAERLLARVTKTFFGPMRVSVMMDANGCNTTAAAAVLCAQRHLPLEGVPAAVLGGTGPVGQRAARILAQAGAHVRLASRAIDRAEAACSAILAHAPQARVSPMAAASIEELARACQGTQLVIAAGAAGVELLPDMARRELKTLRVVIDLNAVPPAGIGGVAATDKGCERDGAICYGALGVGGLKMKIHKAALKRLFEQNDQVLDVAAIYETGRSLAAG